MEVEQKRGGRGSDRKEEVEVQQKREVFNRSSSIPVGC